MNYDFLSGITNYMLLDLAKVIEMTKFCRREIEAYVPPVKRRVVGTAFSRYADMYKIYRSTI